MIQIYRVLVGYVSLIFILFFCSGCIEDSKEDTPVDESITIGAWTDLHKRGVLSGWEDFYSWSDGNAGFFLFQGGEFCSIGIDNFEFIKNVDFPISGDTGTRFTAVTMSSSAFVFSSINDTLYRFDNGKWSAQCELPFWYGYFSGYYQGLVLQNKIYLLSSSKSFCYDLISGEWENKAAMPRYYESEDLQTHIVYGGYSIGGTELNGKAYLLKSEGDFFEFDPTSDNWKYLSKYPGKIRDRIISFSNGNKLFFGLSYIDHSPSYFEKWLENELWSYNLQSGEWTEEEKIPFDLHHGRIFGFNAMGKLYVGHEILKNYYNLYCYNPLASD